MFRLWSRFSHNLNEIHKRSKELLAQNNFHMSQIQLKQLDVFETICLLQKRLSFITIERSLHYDNPISLHDFYLSYTKSKMIEDPEDFGFPKAKIFFFIQQFTKCLPQLTSILNFQSLINYAKEPDVTPIPFHINPIEFFLSSTVPSIFGHYWSSELVENYINFIFDLHSTNRTFTDQYLELSLTNFIRTTCNRTFFTQSFGPPLLDYLFYDSSMTEEKCVQQIILKMHENLFLLPPHIRMVINRISKRQGDNVISTPVFVSQCMILPPIKSPKEWSVLESQYILDVHQKEKLRKVIDLITSISSGVRETNELMYAFNDFIAEAAEFEDVTGSMTLSKVLPLLGKDSISLVFSLLDISLLSYVVSQSPCSLLLKSTAEQLIKRPQNKNNDLYNIYFLCQIKNLCQFNIHIGDNVFRESQDTVNKLTFVSAIFSFFQKAEVVPEAPKNSLKDFLDFHKNYARQMNDMNASVILQIIDMQLPKDNERYFDIFTALTDELKRQEIYVQINSGIFMDLLILHQQVNDCLYKLNGLFEIALNSYQAALFNDFILKNLHLHQQLSAHLNEFFVSQEAFTGFFGETILILKNYCEEIPELYDELVLYYHSWMMKSIPFVQFQNNHPEFRQFDQRIQNADDNVIKLFCIAPAPPQIKQLLENQNLFDDAKQLISAAKKIEIPLIALPTLSSAIEVLNRMYFLEFEKHAQADELTPLIHYLFLACKTPSLYTFIQYLNFYLAPLIDLHLLNLDEDSVVGFTHMFNHMGSLQSFLTNEEKRA